MSRCQKIILKHIVTKGSKKQQTDKKNDGAPLKFYKIKRFI